MNLKTRLFSVLSVVALVAGSSLAGIIDFRTAMWAPADGQATYTVGGITVTALPNGQTIWQDAMDGLGVRGGEVDEIDDQGQGTERLLIDFTSPGGENIRAFYITDLYDAPDGGPNGEDGSVTLTLADGTTQVIVFNGTTSDQANGEQLVDIYSILGDVYVVRAEFAAIDPANTNDDFSVAYVAIPEPGMLSLLGIGLLSLAAFTRRKRRRS